ncbi:molecular chaperone TorD family protein [Campylobacter sp. 9BO]|uniref:TorD/DmsD family molecular chaperone n=1 Tax=Campylobacter sp. 9BO TaxID=3424759 RepID=UPI003D3275BA
MSEHERILNARAIYYLLFSQLFVFTQKSDRYDGVLDLLNTIKVSPLNSECEEAIKRLIPKFQKQNLQNISQEYDDIFHSPPSPVSNTFSHYDEGYETGSACVKVRNLIAKTDIRKNEEIFKENEDNVGFCLLLMHEFIKNELKQNEQNSENQTYASDLFKEIINPYIDEFIEATSAHHSADAYADACVLLENFVEFERVFYAAPKPILEKKIKSTGGISRSETLVREINRRARAKERELKFEE